MNNKIIGSIIQVWTVQYKDNGDIVAVFKKIVQANGYKDELPEHVQSIVEVKQRDAFLYDDGSRVSFFDPTTPYFVYELDIDYEPLKSMREREIKQKALAKLTAEEKKVLNL